MTSETKNIKGETLIKKETLSGLIKKNEFTWTFRKYDCTGKEVNNILK